MPRPFSRRCRVAQSIIETVVGIIFLIPIVLFLFDVAVLILANTANDNLCKNAARAAASATDVSGYGNSGAAGTAATNIVNKFAVSGLIPVRTLNLVDWNGTVAISAGSLPGSIGPTSAAGQVYVVTSMDVQPPVPFPGVDRRTFYAKAVEPIVSIPPN